MTIRQTSQFWIVFLVLLTYYVACEREVRELAEPEVQRENILPMFFDEATAITVIGGGREIRVERYDQRWQVVAPEGVVVPSDLVTALLLTLVEKREAELIAESPSESDLAAFGVDDPRSEIRVERRSGEPMRVFLGDRNPAGTAVYARMGHSQQVFLLGLSVEFYGDLLLEAARSQ
jgi:hypothetical protein